MSFTSYQNGVGRSEMVEDLLGATITETIEEEYFLE